LAEEEIKNENEDIGFNEVSALDDLGIMEEDEKI
jgi:hypothetical protein